RGGSARGGRAADGARASGGIDPRGRRFGAALTAVLLGLAVVLGPGAGTTVLAVVVASFALGAVRGAQGTWRGRLFKRLVQPRLAPPAARADPRPPRFAQAVGLAITGAGVLLTVLGLDWALPVLRVLALLG